jgi:DNA-binding FrmR family transcriptional regulator
MMGSEGEKAIRDRLRRIAGQVPAVERMAEELVAVIGRYERIRER